MDFVARRRYSYSKMYTSAKKQASLALSRLPTQLHPSPGHICPSAKLAYHLLNRLHTFITSFSIDSQVFICSPWVLGDGVQALDPIQKLSLLNL